MNTNTHIHDIAFETGSDNPYADLGLADAAEMLSKAGLAQEIEKIIQSQNLTQQQAAKLLGISSTQLSDLLRGKFRIISKSQMTTYLNQLIAM